MQLKDIPSGDRVFIDANIFIYSILKDRRFVSTSSAFLKRVEAGEIKGFTSALVLNEVLHQLMKAETASARGMGLATAVSYMKSHPASIQQLKLAWIGLQEIKSIPNLAILDFTGDLCMKGQQHAKDSGLLASDGAHVATMELNDLVNLASNDPDFERVPWVKLYRP